MSFKSNEGFIEQNQVSEKDECMNLVCLTQQRHHWVNGYNEQLQSAVSGDKLT